MSFIPSENSEPIPGYVLRERLGAGGYGEVWKVSAPGGLTKAIKIVHGKMDEARAAREMKALGRVRDVRHPFLLSIERFDVQDGQLMVITELADMSLMDRFRECREANLPGIPREELIGYTRDAADALDYMSDKYGLQHLDIKPENLLLVGGRVKVADFGLVKDLQDTQVTTIGGVTPLYATPEAFDGRATRQSDQYSLAIVYQEMLTGVRPFPGQTTAQLAKQHLHSAPMLGSLPSEDRAAIGKALSKKPDHRFATCRQMVDCLTQGAGVQGPSRDGAVSPQATGGVRSAETPSASHLGADSTSLSGQHAPAIEEFEDDATDFLGAAVEIPLEKLGAQPTVFVGAGAVAARVLTTLRRRLDERLGADARKAAFPILALDSDPATFAGGHVSLPPEETLFLPLHKSADYRATSAKILSWLSRRWLYNIPRSQRVEGLRPLGRLALVDQETKVSERIRKAIALAADPSNEQTLAAKTSRMPRDMAPRIVVLGAISGGTGGGAFVDLCEWSRDALSEMGLSTGAVQPVMIHFTTHRTATNELLRTNAHATLIEWNHASRAWTDGNPECLPADAYFAHLGDDLSDAEIETGVEGLARYLALDAISPLGGALDRCRKADLESPGRPSGTRFRAFGLRTIGSDKLEVAGAAADSLCHSLLEHWLGQAPAAAPRLALNLVAPAALAPTPSVEIQPLASVIADDLPAVVPLDPTDVATRLTHSLEAELGETWEAFLARLAKPVLGAEKEESAGEMGSLSGEIERIDEILGTPQDELEGRGVGAGPMAEMLEKLARHVGVQLGDEIGAAVSARVEHPRERISGARRTLEEIKKHIHATRQRLQEVVSRQAESRARARLSLMEPSGAPARGGFWAAKKEAAPPVAGLASRIESYKRERFLELRSKGVAIAIQGAQSRLASLNEHLTRLRHRLEQLSKEMATDPTPPTRDSSAGSASAKAPFRSVVTRAPEIRGATKRELTLDFDREIQGEVIDSVGGLWGMLNASPDAWRHLERGLRERSEARMLTALADFDSPLLFMGQHADSNEAVRALSELAAEARPRTPFDKGARRLLTLQPTGPGAQALRTAARQAGFVSAFDGLDAADEIVLCQETANVALARVAAFLVDGRPDLAAAARRVLTRLDVPWQSIPSVRLTSTCTDSDFLSSSEPRITSGPTVALGAAALPGTLSMTSVQAAT